MNLERTSSHVLWSVLLSFACGILASIFLAKATGKGIGVSPDSVAYLSMARSYVEYRSFEITGRDGYPTPSIHNSLGYPAGVSLLARRLHLPVILAARWESVFFFGATTFLLGLWATTLIGGPAWLPAFAALMFAFTPAVAEVHAWAWSEHGFLFFGFLGLYLVAADGGMGRHPILAGATAALSLSFLYRHSGLVFVLVAVFVLLVSGSPSPRLRWKRAALIAGLSVVPAGFFYVRNKLIMGRATISAFRVFPIRMPDGEDLLRRLREWLSPDDRFRLGIGAALLVLAALVIHHGAGMPGRAREERRRASLLLVSAVLAIYPVFLIFCKRFLIASIPLDQRILSPLFPAGLLALCHVIGRASGSSRTSAVLEASVAALAAVLLLARYAPAKSWLLEARKDSRGYARSGWEGSEVIAAARKLATLLPPEAIFSNGADLLEFETGRRIASVPPRIDYFSGLPNPRYRAEMRILASQVRKGRASVVEIEAIDWRKDDATPLELRQSIGGPFCRNLSDGMICGASTSPEQGRKVD